MTESIEGISPGQETSRSTEGELPEARIFDLLSSVGNGEHKALELIVMREEYSYSSSALYQEVMNHQAKDKRWEMHKNVPFRHCVHSFSPIGLVTKEALSPDGTAWGYQITRFGIETGIPFAGALLKWSYEHPEHSLYKMFGSTNSPSVKDNQALDRKRAPEARYRIFWEIATSSSNKISQVDIVNETNENQAIIGPHLRSLSENGVVTYDQTVKGKPYSFFKRVENVPDKDPETFKHAKTLTTRVWNLLSQPIESRLSEYITTEDIVNSLINQYPEYEDLQKISFSGNVTRILSNLERLGYLQRGVFSHLFHTELTLSEEQGEAIVSLITVIDKFMNGDKETIEESRRFAQRVANDPYLYSDLMLKAKEASPNASRTAREDTAGWITSILYEHPNSTTKQAQEFLYNDYHKRLGIPSTRKHLYGLVNEGRIVAEKTKAGNVYRVAESEEQNNTPQ